ncbi:MAG: lipase family protein, partial [Solirubrobacteraceae bacterium]
PGLVHHREIREITLLALCPRRLRPVVAAIAALVAAGLLASSAAAATVGPAGLAFYTPPSPLPNDPHGTLIWYRPTSVKLGLGVQSVSAWTVLYLSQSINGQADPVTGTVIVPTKAWTGSGPRPVVDYAVGTQGLAEAAAPSMQLVNGGEYENSDIVKALNQNWAVEITDYAGYTTGGVPDYIVGASEGHAVLDIALAATQIPNDGISPGAPLAIWGYSQGGQASAWASQLWPSYAKSIDLVGDASGGVPSNLNDVANQLNGHLGAAFLLYSVIGLNEDYPAEINLDSYVTPAGLAAIKQAEGQKVEASLFTFAFHNIDQYTLNGETLAQLLAVPSIESAIDAQALGTTPITVPMFHYHARSDEIVPLAQDEALNAAYCKLGDTVEFKLYAFGHIAGDFEGAPDSISWIAARFAGTPAPDNCSTSPS